MFAINSWFQKYKHNAKFLILATLPEKQPVSLRNTEWIVLKHLGVLLKFDAFQLLVISDQCNGYSTCHSAYVSRHELINIYWRVTLFKTKLVEKNETHFKSNKYSTLERLRWSSG